MAGNTISTEEWLSELARLTLKDSEGETMEEMRKRTGLGKEALSSALNAAREIGRLEAGWRQRVALDGRIYKAPVYRILPPVSKPRQLRSSVNRSPQSRRAR